MTTRKIKTDTESDNNEDIKQSLKEYIEEQEQEQKEEINKKVEIPIKKTKRTYKPSQKRIDHLVDIRKKREEVLQQQANELAQIKLIKQLDDENKKKKVEENVKMTFDNLVNKKVEELLSKKLKQLDINKTPKRKRPIIPKQEPVIDHDLELKQFLRQQPMSFLDKFLKD